MVEEGGGYSPSLRQGHLEPGNWSFEGGENSPGSHPPPNAHMDLQINHSPGPQTTQQLLIFIVERDGYAADASYRVIMSL